MTAEISNTKRWRRRLPWLAAGLMVLAPLAILYVMAATDPTDNIVLARSEVAQTPGGRVWKGVIWNHSDSLYTDLDTVILFLDRDGKPVGQARGAADRLDPGEYYEMEAALAPEAAQLQIYQMRWTSYGNRAVLGPYRPWPFGYVQDAECGPWRLKIGACTPMRARD